jgi:proliferating cell nuclear antigen
MVCIETEPTDPNLMLELTTVQTGAIKILIEGLKDYLLDCNIELIPYHNEDGSVNPASGLKILALNHKEGMLIHVKLNASEFNRFYCKEKQILGINMQILHRIIRSMNNNDILTLRRYSSILERTQINLVIENMDREQKSKYKIQLMDVDSDIMEMTAAKFEAVVIMNSSDFQKACRDLNGLETKYIDIVLSDNTLQLKGEGGLAIGTAEFHDTKAPTSSITIKRKSEIEDMSEDSDTPIDPNMPLLIRGKYDIKNLMLFTKCTNLCSHIEIYLKNDYPLLIKYTVANLGYTHLVLSPVMCDEI